MRVLLSVPVSSGLYTTRTMPHDVPGFKVFGAGTIGIKYLSVSSILFPSIFVKYASVGFYYAK